MHQVGIGGETGLKLLGLRPVSASSVPQPALADYIIAGVIERASVAAIGAPNVEWRRVHQPRMKRKRPR
jgi:hypothetical protein